MLLLEQLTGYTGLGDSTYSSQGVRRRKGEEGTESGAIGEGAEQQIAAFPTIPSAWKRFPIITAPAISLKKRKKKPSSGGGL